jgi:hypothetical protein
MLMFRFPFVIATAQAAIAVRCCFGHRWLDLAHRNRPRIVAVGRQGLWKMLPTHRFTVISR